MEKGNGKTIAVVSLVVAVFALAVGFATFSANLTIDSGAQVVPGDTFSPDVNWKTIANTSPTCTVNSGSNANAAVTSAGSLSGKSWSGVQLKLVAPGDSITCTATMENQSTFVAYLRSISTNNGVLQCAATSSAVDGISPATNADAVCPKLSMVITAAANNATDTTVTSTVAANNTFSGQNALAVTASGGTQTVSFTLTYTSTNSVEADGAIDVTIPTITLNYQTEAGS